MYTINKVQVWAADILNQPGTLAHVLECVGKAGAQLEFMIARRVNEGTSRVFLAPLKGAKQVRAAAEVGLVPAAGMHSLRVEGPDRPGLGSALTRSVAAEALNLRGASAAAVGRKAVLYLAFESEEALKAATKAVRKVLRSGARR